MPSLTVLVVVILVLYVLVAAVAMSILFAHNGIAWWQAFVPIWNIYQLITIAELPNWWLTAWLISFIFPVFTVVITSYIFIGVANRCNKSAGYGLGLVFLAPLFWPLLVCNLRK